MQLTVKISVVIWLEDFVTGEFFFFVFVVLLFLLVVITIQPVVVVVAGRLEPLTSTPTSLFGHLKINRMPKSNSIEVSIASLMVAGTSPTTSTSFRKAGFLHQALWIKLIITWRMMSSASSSYGLVPSSTIFPMTRWLLVVISVLFEPVTTIIVIMSIIK